jgi:transposase
VATRLTPEQIELAKAMYIAGYPRKAIHKTVPCSYQTITRITQNLREKPSDKMIIESYQRTGKLAHTATELDISIKSVRNALQRNGVEWTTTGPSKIKAYLMDNPNLTFAQIYETLGGNSDYIKQIMRQMKYSDEFTRQKQTPVKERRRSRAYTKAMIAELEFTCKGLRNCVNSGVVPIAQQRIEQRIENYEQQAKELKMRVKN